MIAARTLTSVVLVACLVTGCGREKVASPPRAGTYERPLNVLLVTIDTLRADHLGCHGHFRDTSPALDALAAEGLRFSNCHSTMGTTLPSHLSILTGLLPHQHGQLANKGAGPAYRPSAGRESVALFFQRAGYRTGAFVSGQTLKRVTGIDAGFDEFTQPPEIEFKGWRDVERPARDTNADALAWLAEADERPFFAWVHYWDPHEPNDPPENYAERFPVDEQRVDALLAERRVDPSVLRERFNSIELARLFFPELVPDFGAPAPELPEIDATVVRGLYRNYDAEVRYADDRLGELLAEVRRLGLWESTIVVVTADHGQSLGQHDWLEHGRITLDNVHVPLVFRFPGEIAGEPATVDTLVSGIDVMATVVARLPQDELRAYLAQSEGRDLLSGSFDRTFAIAHQSFENRARRSPDEPQEPLELHLALAEGRWRYHYSRTIDDEGEASERGELYDVVDDPGELVDIASREPRRAAGMRGLLLRQLGRRRFEAPPFEGTLSEAERRNLEALRGLGYVAERE